MKWLPILLAAFALTASAADVTGTWKGTAETPAGTIERTFIFKVDGNTLTGETSSQMMGKSTIEDGKIDGDNLSFSIKVSFQGNDMKLNYKGVVKDAEIKFHVASDNGLDLDYVAKKVT
jgi:hypothetical protein